MLREIVDFFRRCDEPVKTVLLGSFFTYYGIYSIVLWIGIMGYLVRTLDRAGSDEPAPVFDRWRALFVDGVNAFLIWGAFLLVPVAIAASGGEGGAQVAMTFLLLLAGGGIFSLLIPLLALVGPEPSVVQGAITSPATAEIRIVSDVASHPELYLLLLLTWYVTPAALLNYTRSRRLADGFDFGAIREIVATPRYAAAWVGFMTLWWIGFGATLLWTYPPEYPIVDRLVAAVPSAGVGSQLGEIAVALSFAAQFSMLVLAYAVIGFAVESGRGSRTRSGGETR